MRRKFTSLLLKPYSLPLCVLGLAVVSAHLPPVDIRAGAVFLSPKPLFLILKISASAEILVGLDGLEPSTPALSTQCSNQLS